VFVVDGDGRIRYLHRAIAGLTYRSTDELIRAVDAARNRLVDIEDLPDEELARLAARTEKVRKDFAAGALTNQQITYIIIALATALIVVIIVVAR